MDRKDETKIPVEEAWPMLTSLLKNAKVTKIQRRRVTRIKVVVHSIETVLQFEKIIDALPGLYLENKVPYKKKVKIEFQQQAKRLENARNVMYMEVDEMSEEDLERMGIDVEKSDDVRFDPSWYPKEHWYDWEPQFEKYTLVSCFRT